MTHAVAVCLICGSNNINTYSGKTVVVGEGDFQEHVDNVSGYDCLSCEDGMYDGNGSDEHSSAYRIWQAHDRVVMNRRNSSVAKVIQIIDRLKLTDEQAADIFTGGSQERLIMLKGHDLPIFREYSQKIHLIANMDNIDEMKEALHNIY